MPRFPIYVALPALRGKNGAFSHGGCEVQRTIAPGDRSGCLGMSAEDKASSERDFQRSSERRQLTVMFCDLVGSTEAATALDPEELSEVLRVYRAHVAAAIGNYSGTIAQYLGDGVLAYFGYPQATENDAERAVRAALEIIHDLPALTHSNFRFNVRIGIATGLVVIGQPRDTPLTGERLAVGETPNLAARLQAMAPPNGILISDSTRRLVGGLFELASRSGVQAKGFAGPVSAFEVLSLSPIDSRFEALRGEATPFIGREDEVALLRRRWDQARGGEGRVVLLSGEAGIGKSRILNRVRQEFEIAPGHCLRFFCSPLHTQSALFPFLSHMKKAAELGDEDTDAEKLAKLTRFFGPILDEPAVAAEDMAGLLGISVQSQRLASLTAPQRKDAAIKAFLDYPIALSRQAPVLVILEDAHWIDPTSVELLDRLVSEIVKHRILLIVTARPEYQPVWIPHPSVTLISLSRFGWRDGAAVISGVAGGKALPPELTEQILERSDGVPLFLEELTRTLLDSGVLEEAEGGFRLRGLLPDVALPSTLQDSLTARLDRLGPVKGLAEVGSVIGREFSHELLQSVAGLADAELDDGLARLIASGLVYRRGTVPDAVYFFRHALIQDAAYGTLLKSRRQQLHATIADTILANFPGIAAAQPEVIAHHLTAAEEFSRAIDYWLIAGKAQIRASADLEAINHLKRGIGLLDRVADQAQRQQAELKLQTALIGPLVAVKGASSPEVADCCERGFALSRIGGISPMVFPFMYGQFTYNVSTGKIRQAAETARKFIQIAEAAKYASGTVVGNRMLGLALLALGEYRQARQALETALANYLPERDDNVTFLFGQNVKVNSQTVLSLALYCLGEYEASRRIGLECIRAAEKLKHPHTTAIAINYQLQVHYLAGEFEELHAQARRMVDISTEFGLEHFATIGRFFAGHGLYIQGQVAAGIAQMEKALETFERLNLRLGCPGYLCILARAKCELGEIAEARTLCAEAQALMEECEEFWCAPEVLCVEAEIALRSEPPEPERARSLLDEAASRARGLGSPAFEERCEAARERLFAERVELDA